MHNFSHLDLHLDVYMDVDLFKAAMLEGPLTLQSCESLLGLECYQVWAVFRAHRIGANPEKLDVVTFRSPD